MSCCADPACSHAVVAAATREATYLTDHEREIILGVLGRDELLRRDHQTRVLHLKAELQSLRRKGALKVSGDWDNAGPDPDRTCGRCRVELGRVINRGAFCRACRLKVCKSCREYSLRTSDWVCVVCHKQMEIQAASGEWMNEFVRRPSRRRDNRVYVPAADIIKRTIRRSWTISNPTPRWTTPRSSHEFRPYSSLPRSQDINDFPSLALHQTNLRNQQNPPLEKTTSPLFRRRSPTRRTQSEDVYNERTETFANISMSSNSSGETSVNERPLRINPLMKLAETRQRDRKISPRRKLRSDSSGESTLADDVTDNKNKGFPSPDLSRKAYKSSTEKRVSFDSNTTNGLTANVLRSQSLTDGKTRGKRHIGTKTFQETSDKVHAASEGNIAKEDPAPVELCDIEPLSGTVFRKMTVRRRRQDIRKLPAVDAGLDFLLPDGDDYKLVFISSDSSSKEEDVDDNDSSSTASSFPIDECDWDYFEPGTGTGTRTATAVLSWNSPFSSPRVYRRNVLESPLGSPIVYRRRRTRESDTGTDEDTTRFDSGSPASSDSLFQTRTSSEEPLDPIRNETLSDDSTTPKCKHSDDQPKKPCQNCGGGTPSPQYIPIPVPVPIPFPVPAALWTNQESFQMFGSQLNAANIDQNIASRLRVIPRSLWPYYTQAALIWPLINNTAVNGAGAPATDDFGTLNSIFQNEQSTTAGTTTMPPVATDHDNSQQTTACSNKTNTETDDAHNEEFQESNTVNLNEIVQENNEITGYLECENQYVTSSDSSRDSSDSSDTSGNENRKPRLRRVYNVNSGESQRQSDDALPSSNVTSDCDEDGRHSHSSVREDDMSSSGSDDTDSDDTGTVADRKPKKFSRIFVVNKNISSSSSNPSSGNSDTDTSDNDTDTELDCTVILMKIKPIGENLSEEKQIDNTNDIEDKASQRFPNCDNQSDDKDNKEICSLVSVNDTHSDSESNIKQIKEREYMSSSPGLSDVSAESLNSSDVEQVRGYTLETVPENNSREYYLRDHEEAVVEEKVNSLQQYSTTLDGKELKEDNGNLPKETSPGEMIFSQGEKIDSVSDSVEIENHEEDCDKSISSLIETRESDDGNRERFSEWNKIRANDDVKVGDTTVNTRDQAGGPTKLVSSEYSARNAARYTSLVMITQEPAPSYQQVNVVTSDTTTLVPDNNDVIVKHTNWQDCDGKQRNSEEKLSELQLQESVTVITGGDTLSAFEEGLADDDSWVENLSHEDEDDDDEDEDSSSSGDEVTLRCSAAIDQEDELRGYHRSAIDFTLHTIVEESCEESEVEQNAASKKKERPASATDLEKYFFFGLGDGTVPSINSNREDAISETSSIYSEGMESLGGPDDNQHQNDHTDPAELASSRLEKYFLSGFMGFTAERRDSDGSVGSDSEGRPSPEQRRKKLVRARGTGRSHSSSLDNLDKAENDQILETQMNSEDSSSSDSDTYDENNSFEKSDGQFDTVKRKKGKKKAIASSAENLEITHEVDENDKDSDEDEDGHKTPQPEVLSAPTNLTTNKDQQSRDSGFIGSCDDLLKEQRESNTPEVPFIKNVNITENITEEKKLDGKFSNPPPATSLTRKDSFNNWSSDEETNLMMCKMRQFFKTMIANSQCPSSKPGTPNLSSRMSPKPLPSPRVKSRCKPPQLVYFENELTRLMKTVPGIRDDQVREIVEYLSSEDTWSDSYDSSDYTSSDLEGAASKKALQQQISDSCKQIINKFDNTVDDEGDEGDGGIIDESHGLNKETAFVYQKLVASLEKMATGDTMNLPKLTPQNSPPLIAKVMHHIGSRLVALMHEVSSSESHASNSPKAKHYHRRLQHKISSASSTTTEDDGPDMINENDKTSNFEDTHYNLLPRSRSHDLLVGENRNLTQSSNGVSDAVEEREASDCERFSWRGSFESALLATDSRNRLSLLGSEGSASASALAIAAKRRSAGDLLFSHQSLSREQLDRVRSCGSIGGANSEDKLWVATATRPNRRRSSVPDASCGSGGSADGEDEDDEIETRSTLPRNLQSGPQTTNSLPRLPTNTSSNTMQKSQSMYHFLPQNVKSARYRPPGLSRLTGTPKRAVSAPGLQASHQRRGRRSQQQNVPSDDVLSEAHSSPMLASRNSSKSATPSPVAPGSRSTTGSATSQEWHNEDDIDRLVGLQGRSSLSSLGVRSDSMASVYSGAGEGRYGTVTVRGQVEFGLQYNYKAGALEILIKQCKDLAPVDVKRNRSDPYVKVYLLPDKSKSGKRKTKVKKHTLNPVFDECLKFHISLNGLETRTLWLTVWHSDMFGRNDFLGEVMMTLENKVFDDPTPKWYNLQERTEPFEELPAYKGDIIVCLKFVPPDMTLHKKGKRSRGALHVLVKEAKSLTAVKANGTSDPFCKSYLLPEKGRSSKQKTHVARRTINPVWNYTFVYDDVTLQELAERSLELTVWDHDRLASNEFLGGVRFSLGTGKHYGKSVEWMDACGKELNLWKSMLERPNFWVEGCVSLRPTLDTRML